MIELRVLGSLDLRAPDGRDLDPVLRHPKRLALLAYLAAARPRGFHRRDALLALLWPDLDQSHARNALRQAVHFLRDALGRDVLAARGEEELGLDLRRVSCDVADLEDRLNAGQPQSALSLYRGDLLSAFHLSDAPEFERWLDQEREHLRRQVVGAALALAQEEETRGRPLPAARWAGRALEISPYDEGALRQLLRLLDQAGDRAEAIREYDAFARRLAADLGLDPAPETTSVAEAIRARVAPRPGVAYEIPLASTPGPAAAMASPRGPREARPPVEGRRARWAVFAALGFVVLVAGSVLTRRLLVRAPAVGPSAQSVAVLPFVNFSGDSTNEYLSDGLSEELISTLAQIPGLRVPARTSSFYFKGKALPVRQIGESLGVAYVVEGTLRRVGDQLRITAQLVKVEDGYHLWSETYDRELAGVRDVLAVQQEIARAIVEPLQVKLAVRAAPRPEDLEAYELYLKGRFFWNRGTEEGLTRALQFFNAAIAKDSGYARAHAGLALTYDRLVFFNNRSAADAYPQAQWAAERAVALDPQLAEAYTARGLIRYMYAWEWARAEADFRRAVALDRGYALGHLWYGRFLVSQGRLAEGIREASRAAELDPLSAHVLNQYSYALRDAGQYERAIEQVRKAIELEPGPQGHQDLGRIYLAQGKFEDAIREFQIALRLPGSGGRKFNVMAQLGHTYARAGRREEARKILDELNRRATRADSINRPFQWATLYAALGDNDQAFAWLERAYQERSPWITLLRVYQFYDPLRSDPRFNELLKKVGL